MAVAVARLIRPLRSSSGGSTVSGSLEIGDSFKDGTPDFVRLDDPSDVRTFREWFTLIAETEAFRSPNDLAAEVNDCAGLVRFAYREALKEHTGTWANDMNLPLVAGPGSVKKFNYPHTPLGAGLFRIRAGMFTPADLKDGVFQQFADAETLTRFNTHLLSRRVEDARPGDLLVFRQMGQSLPFHLMILIGASRIDSTQGPWIVYHTGPIDGHRGAMRRVTLAELMRHPEVRWHPIRENRAFLGVFRWNILRGVAQ
jgi:uncharacterized protein YfaT (DUF1175 family)